MRKMLYKLIDLISKLISKVISLKIIRLFGYTRNRIYSDILKQGFYVAGENFRIDYPANILGEKYISVGKNFTSFARLRLESYDRHLDNVYTPAIIIGDNVSINFDCHIGCVNRIVIGNNVLFASKIFITDHMHGEITAEALKIPPALREVVSKGPVIIEDNVWIGEGVAIMPNLTIGKNSIIGANSVVTSTIPPNSVAAGIPARVIKTLCSSEGLE